MVRLEKSMSGPQSEAWRPSEICWSCSGAILTTRAVRTVKNRTLRPCRAGLPMQAASWAARTPRQHQSRLRAAERARGGPTRVLPRVRPGQPPSRRPESDRRLLLEFIYEPCDTGGLMT